MEEKILAAAKELFMQYGFDRVSTTQIAKKAGCNQALVHYYYRTKPKLFQKVLGMELQMMFEQLLDIPKGKETLEEKVERIIDIHFSFLEANPDFPLFIFGEMRDNTEAFIIFREEIKSYAGKFMSDLQMVIDQQEKECGVRMINAFDLIFNILSLNIFVFLFKPFVGTIWELEEDRTKKIMAERKRNIKETVISSLRIA